MKAVRACEVCGCEFFTTEDARRYCSSACYVRARWALATQPNLAHNEKPPGAGNTRAVVIVNPAIGYALEEVCCWTLFSACQTAAQEGCVS